MLSHDKFKSKMLAEPAVRKEYEELNEEFSIIQALIEARLQAGLSQADIAELMGTKAPAVCRIESTEHSPTIRTLRKYAAAVGCRLEIKLFPQASS